MKMGRGKNGLTKAEFLQREIDEAVVERVDEILFSIAKKKVDVADIEEGESK